ncbi:MAG: alpha/beta hydrolase [Desulfurivibrio sp.]|jgi:pimeloyl-ACP methyl ester carboxylesterase|nr:MAG: alpha/beta hydrolase [Desulfurivibrio sp.]
MPRSTGKRDHEWLDYYEKFPYFSAAAVRDGCHPRRMEHQEPAAKSIVLVHGLTDSPYFLTAIGDYFFNDLGCNVYLPLLHGHGLKEPQGMEGVSLEEWKANVDFAVDYAAAKTARVSIGGFSTGGTLGFYSSTQNRKINGTLYLFSAALDLAGGIGGLVGELKERLLRTFLADVLDNNQPLIGANPYRYSRMDLDGARELALLIRETDELLKQFTKKKPFAKPVFAAHSESDATANITGIEDLQQVSLPDQFAFFRIPAAVGVPHASLVLKEPIYAANSAPGEAPLEKANPLFQQMMAAMAAMG